MKKIYLIFLAFALVMTGANAQDLNVGVKGGTNVAYINGDEEIAGDNVRIAYHFGGYVDIVFSDHLSLQPEVLFSSQGTVYDDYEENFGEGSFSYTDDRFILDYVNVPVMVKFYPVKGFSIQAGPQVGFLLSAKNKYKENGTSVDEDFKDSSKNVDFGLAAGLGYKTGFGLNIDARYIHGLTDINDLQVLDKINNQVIQVSLGYSFIR